MIALFFEVSPSPGNEDKYLAIAGSLRSELDASGGVLFLDRYRSLTRPATMLSHQLWLDEASLARWRANGHHYAAQTCGRQGVFEDYRLRVGAVVAEMVLGRDIAQHEPGITYKSASEGAAAYVAVVRSMGQPMTLENGEVWRSVYDDTSYAWVGELPSKQAGVTLLGHTATLACVSAAQLCLVSRDYGMFDRSQAPQYFPPITPT